MYIATVNNYFYGLPPYINFIRKDQEVDRDLATDLAMVQCYIAIKISSYSSAFIIVQFLPNMLDLGIMMILLLFGPLLIVLGCSVLAMSKLLDSIVNNECVIAIMNIITHSIGNLGNVDTDGTTRQLHARSKILVTPPLPVLNCNFYQEWFLTFKDHTYKSEKYRVSHVILPSSRPAIHTRIFSQNRMKLYCYWVIRSSICKLLVFDDE